MDEVELLPSRNEALEVAEFDAELVVFDPRCKQVHLLDGLAAVVFGACDGVTARRELLTDMVQVLELSVDDADVRVLEILAAFEGLGLLEGTEYEEPPP